MFIIDAHLDLAYSAIEFGRDLLDSVESIREKERNQRRPNGTATVSLPALRDAGVGLVFGTLYVAPAKPDEEHDEKKLAYRTQAEAHRQALRQLDYYRRLADEVDYMRLVVDRQGLDEVVTSHSSGNGNLLGIVPLMEGADPIRKPDEAEFWYEQGLRLIGLAWDDTRYSGGAWKGKEGLTNDGRRLLDLMADLGVILDLTHMSEKATLQAIDSYEGRLVATHCNARSLVPGERQLSDLQIRRIAERDGIIGVVLANGFLKEGGWNLDKNEVSVDHIVAHIDHICQCVGDADHVGIGSDLDGGFGLEKVPSEIDTVADLPIIGDALQARGYETEDVAGIMGGNWLRLLRDSL